VKPFELKATQGGPYGNQYLNSERRRQYLEFFRVIIAYAIADETNPVFAIKVRIPSSQVRVKISVNWEPAAGSVATPALGAGQTIWLAAADEAVGGASSQDVPNSNVIITPAGTVITKAAPLGFPVDNGLIGFSMETVTAADYIIGQLALPAPGLAGAWVLKTSYQPEAVVLPEDAWQEIARMAGVPEVQRISG
jgi:hypothetical protein